MCVTRESYNRVALDLTTLLEKAPDDLYPWVISIFDLETVVEAWEYLKLEEKEFIRFIGEREKLHGHLLTSDEMDIVGYFLKHDGLHWLIEKFAEYDVCFIPPNYTNIFDEIYRAKSSGEDIEFTVTKPTMGTDFKSIYSKTYARRVGRNDPCPCCSGKKYKHCCII